MPGPEKAIFLKQSGEIFKRGATNGEIYTEQGRLAVAQTIALAFQNRRELGVSGITVIPGAGNIARGNELESQDLADPDTLGRMGILMNVKVLADDLTALGIDVETMIAPGMGFWDPHIEFSAYDTARIKDEHEADKVVIIGGGAGLDGKTTDFASIYYASRFTEVYDGQVVVLKSTKHDGIFDSDPAKNKKARRYKLICAQEMLDDYERFKAMDKASLELLAGHDLRVHVYAEDKHSLVEVIKHQAAQPEDSSIGTIVSGQPCKAVFYD